MDIGYNSEYTRLESVLLHIPIREEIIGHHPDDAMYEDKPDYDLVIGELKQYMFTLQSLGIKVYSDIGILRKGVMAYFPNLIFMRDLAAVIPNTIILANMKYEIRRGEPYCLKDILRFHGYKDDIYELCRGTFEGADFLWRNPSTVLLSVGNRTSTEVIDSMKDILNVNNICLEVILSDKISIPQHILGQKHIASDDILISRTKISNHDFGYKTVIELDETEEVVKRYAMNIVTLAPNVIIMPDDCPETKKIFESYGIVCHTSPMKELRKMAGGFACMTLPLKREML